MRPPRLALPRAEPAWPLPPGVGGVRPEAPEYDVPLFAHLLRKLGLLDAVGEASSAVGDPTVDDGGVDVLRRVWVDEGRLDVMHRQGLGAVGIEEDEVGPSVDRERVGLAPSPVRRRPSPSA